MRNLRDYGIITGSYWVFTLTDGALRMLVLLHLHQLGRSPFEIAALFLLYELFGIVTNLFGGWVGARYGLKSTLFSGLGLQVAACSLLAANAAQLSVPVLLVSQALSGTAKDLTKMSSKSYVKLVVPSGDLHGLLRWVALLTGSKNTLKGIGFFLGGWLLTSLGFERACLGMAAALAITLLVSTVMLPRAAGRSKAKLRLSQLIAHDAPVNWLSAARFFLFGSRDIWFVLALPIFLSSSLGLTHPEVGAFLALWVIGYGIVQALAPGFLGGRRGDAERPAPDAKRLARWTAVLLIPLGGLVAGLALDAPAFPTLVTGLVLFGFVFASVSAIHSFLIVAFADDDQVSLKVGFYYMANAGGRLIGTVLSGALFQAADQGKDGLVVCLVGSMVFVAASALLCLPIRVGNPRAAQPTLE